MFLLHVELSRGHTGSLCWRVPNTVKHGRAVTSQLYQFVENGYVPITKGTLDGLKYEPGANVSIEAFILLDSVDKVEATAFDEAKHWRDVLLHGFNTPVRVPLHAIVESTNVTEHEPEPTTPEAMEPEHEPEHEPTAPEAPDTTKPEHYRKGSVECLNAIASATVDLTGVEAFLVGSAMKYLWRWKQKNGVEDLRKAKECIQRLIDTQ